MSDSDQDPSLGSAKQLAAKVAAVMQAIGGVPKTGKNDYHGYEYSTDDDVMGKVRPAMAEHGLVALPAVKERSTRRVSTGPDESDYTLHTHIALESTLIDTDSGEQRTMTWEGEAQDGQDKGLYKAYTSAIKYFMLKLCQLSADTDVETHDAAAGRNGQQSGPQKPSESQLEYARDLAQNGVWTEAERERLKQRIPASSKSDLSDLIDHMKSVVENGREVLNGG